MESNLPVRTAHLTTKEEQMTADQRKTQPIEMEANSAEMTAHLLDTKGGKTAKSATTNGFRVVVWSSDYILDYLLNNVLPMIVRFN